MNQLKVAILGLDGYLGWSLTLKLLSRGHDIVGIDSFFRRRAVREIGSQSVIPIAGIADRIEAAKEKFRKEIEFEAGTTMDYSFLKGFLDRHRPDSIVNLAQQPSPHYSMKSPKHATFTQANNVCGSLNLLWAVRKMNYKIPIVTLGTLGEYGFPNMPIPEGFFKAEFEGMEDILPFPRQGNSVYHVSKIQTTDNIWFACRVWVMKVTDIHQGVVYGTRIDEMGNNSKLRTRFDIDECFGTSINRFVACAVSGHPIVAYGSGYQIRGYIALRDSIKCITLAVEKPPSYEDSFHGHRVLNQFDECYSISQLAELVKRVGEEKFGLDIRVEHVENPRVEAEVHYYNPHNEKLKQMGFRTTRTLEEELEIMFEDILEYKDRIKADKIRPRIRWRDKPGNSRIPISAVH